MKKTTIESSKDGPFIIRNLKTLKDSNNKNIETQETMLLCRCGKSSKKPFCDGSHSKEGFHSGKENNRLPDKTDVYIGDNISIFDNRGVCSQRRYCSKYSPNVFNPHNNPWINPDNDDNENTKNTIKMCPSGALSYETSQEEYRGMHKRKPQIKINKNGPYDVTGGPGLIDPDNCEPESREHYTLCRCGKSKNKPFCDGAHWYIGFNDKTK